MNTRSANRQAFTLIELLVVITIIAVLAGLLLPVTSRVMENARKASAKNTETQIVAAVNSYYTEYGAYPVPPVAPAGDYTYDVAGTQPNTDLFGVLRATNTVTASDNRNAKRIVYFEYKNVKSVAAPKDGFIAAASPNSPNGAPLVAGDLVDAWGNLYGVRMDAGYTNAVVNPYANDSATANDTLNSDGTTTPASASLVHTGVISYCYGTDGKKSNNGTVQNDPSGNVSASQGDDVISWQ